MIVIGVAFVALVVLSILHSRGDGKAGHVPPDCRRCVRRGECWEDCDVQ